MLFVIYGLKFYWSKKLNSFTSLSSRHAPWNPVGFSLQTLRTNEDKRKTGQRWDLILKTSSFTRGVYDMRSNPTRSVYVTQEKHERRSRRRVSMVPVGSHVWLTTTLRRPQPELILNTKRNKDLIVKTHVQFINSLNSFLSNYIKKQTFYSRINPN